ncbi:MAG TPA: hypothetical protein VNO21_16050 [Polyangiaceae bacterium]|nr:hypothetical protein [Polyangiaceae bacterium]
MANRRTRGAAGGFPTTRHSALLGLRSADPEIRARNLARIARLYWRPIYKHVRLRWSKSPDEAEEITQEFLLRAVGAGIFRAYEAERGHFRTFLRALVDHFAIDRARSAFTRKRGQGTITVPLDIQTLEGELRSDASPEWDPAEFFEREWIRSLVAISIESLRAVCQEKGKAEHFRVFERWYSERHDESSYAAIAADLDLSVTTVMNRLHYARKEFRAVVLAVLREFTTNEQELRAEARAVLGIERYRPDGVP